MRHAIIAVVALAACGCQSRRVAQVATAPTVAIPSDSVPTAITRDSLIRKPRITDSLVYSRMRRLLADADSLLKDLRMNPPKNPNPSPTEASVLAGGRGVFTDSALHVKLCARGQLGEAWQQVCVPKDQSVTAMTGHAKRGPTTAGPKWPRTPSVSIRRP